MGSSPFISPLYKTDKMKTKDVSPSKMSSGPMPRNKRRACMFSFPQSLSNPVKILALYLCIKHKFHVNLQSSSLNYPGLEEGLFI